MKSTLFTILFNAVFIVAFSQQVISPGGSTFTNSQGSISITIGETFVSTSSTVGSSGGTAYITQGFQQSVLQTITATKPIVINDFFKVYPSPASNKVNVVLSGNKNKGSSIDVIDVFGSVVLSIENSKNSVAPQVQTNTEIDIANLASGIYIVKVGGETIPFMKN